MQWSLRAGAGLEAFLDYLAARAPGRVRDARNEAYAAVAGLGDFPFAHRESRWPGLREFVLRRWKKLIVYRVEADRVVILAFLDLRQDLGALAPPGD